MRYDIKHYSNEDFIEYDNFERAKNNTCMSIENTILSTNKREVLSTLDVNCNREQDEWTFKVWFPMYGIGGVNTLSVNAFFCEKIVEIEIKTVIGLTLEEQNNLDIDLIKEICADYDMEAFVGDDSIIIKSDPPRVKLNEGLIEEICDTGVGLYYRKIQSDEALLAEFLIDQMMGALYVLKTKKGEIFPGVYNEENGNGSKVESNNKENEEEADDESDSCEDLAVECSDFEDSFSEDSKEEKVNNMGMSLKDLKKLIKEAKKRIVGQDEYIENAAFCMYEGINNNPKNMLVVGPTGCGKTYTIETLIDILKKSGKDIQFIKEDVSGYTSSGFKGGDVEQIKKKIQKANFVDRDLIVVFFDEIDKLLVPEYDAAYSNVNAEIQGELLSVLTGDVCATKEGTEKLRKNLMFVCTGAFVGLDEIESKKYKNSKGMGFNAEDEVKETKITERVKLEELLIEYGAIPEFIGRINYFLKLNNLTCKDYMEIATNEEYGVIKQLEEEYKKYGYNLKFRKNLIEEIIDGACNQPLGARYVKSAFSVAAMNSFLNRMKSEDISQSKDQLTVCKGDLSK